MTNEEIDELVQKTDIVSLVTSKGIALEKKGKNYLGLCPFHNEKTPSFVVSPEKKLATCFGCHKGGGPLQFIMEIEHVEFCDALRELCEFNGVEYKDSNNSKKKVDPNLKYYELMNVSKNFYKKYLNQTDNGLKALKYLNDRGLNEEIINDFDIGLSPDYGDTIYQVLNESGYLELDIVDCGLVDKKKETGSYYDLFVNRIMFPIKDEFDHVVGYSARIYDQSQTDQPKYVNTRETKIFKKGELLFNLNKAKYEITKKNRIILHEGQMDVIASYRAGLKEAVCSLGTALTNNQVQRLSRYSNNVIICYDGDKAGRAASVKAINTFKNNGFNVHLVLLPDNMDPDEFIKKYGADEYVKYFEDHIVDSLRYLFENSFINKNLEDKDQFNILENEIFQVLHGESNNAIVEGYLKEFAQRVNRSYESIDSDYHSYKMLHTSNKNNPVYQEEDPYNNYFPVDVKEEPERINLSEYRIFRYAMRSKNLALKIDVSLQEDLDGLSKEILELWNTLIYKYYENYLTFNETIFIKMLNDNEMNTYLSINEALRNDYTPYNENDLDLCIKKIKDQKLTKVIKKLRNKVSNTSNVEDQSKMLDQMFKNKRLKTRKG